MRLGQRKLGACATNLIPWCHRYNWRVWGHPWPRELLATVLAQMG